MAASLEDTLKQYLQNKAIRNAALSYSDYLSSLGKTDASANYEKRLRGIAHMDASANSGYGALGETLAAKGMTNSGYRDYLTRAAKARVAGAKADASADLAKANADTSSAYRDYLAAYRQKQESRMNTVIREINTAKMLDYDAAYRYALERGLSAENAKTAATDGVKQAENTVRSGLMKLVLTQKMTQRRATTYAKGLGLSDQVAEEIGLFAKAMNQTSQNATSIPDFYREYLENNQ